MSIDIIVVPDIYYRNWDTPQGEMWLVLRPLVYTGKKSNSQQFGDRLSDFLAWARSPHKSLDGSDHRFRFISPHSLNLGAARCAPDDCYLPIALPSDVDVEIQVGRGMATQQLIRVPRSIACKVSPRRSNDPTDAFADPTDPGVPRPRAYAWTSNEETRQMFDKVALAPSELDKALFYWQQQLESGRQLRVRTGRVLDVYDPLEVPMPVLGDGLNPNGPLTSVFWFLGQMIRIGTQAKIERLRSIDRLDIFFKVNGKTYDQIPFPDTQGGQESALAYFSKVGVDFARSLECEIDRREHRVYVAPGFRSALPDETLRAQNIWVLERPADRAEDSAKAIPPYLNRLASLEIRGALSSAPPGTDEPPLTKSVGNTVGFIPGLLVKGALKPYRRYPMLKASIDGELKRTTVLEFVPDASVARELEALRVGLGPVAFTSLFATSKSGWKFSLLHAGPLPWDGPQTKYRVAAEPLPGSTSTAGQSLMCEEPSLALFIAPFGNASEMIAATKVDKSRSLWRGDTGTGAAASAGQLAEQWDRRVGPIWSKLEFNALQVFGLTESDRSRTAVTLMMLDEFSLNAADSAVRLERTLATTALSPRTALLCDVVSTDPRNFDPLRDYEDDYVNQNSAQIWFAKAGPGKPRESLLGPAVLRTPARTEVVPATCRVCDVNRRQTIPLLHSWPSDPLNRPQSEWPSQVLPEMVRREIALRYELVADAEAGPYAITLEHTYGDRILAAKNGVPIEFSRSRRRDWPVQMVTAIGHPDPTVPGFVSCGFERGSPERVRLRFDLSFLHFGPISRAVFEPGDQAPSAADRELRRRYSVAVSAWRALAELASPKATVHLLIRQAIFSLETGLSKLASPVAASLAGQGFPEGWAGGVGEQLPPITFAEAALADLRTWARDLLTKPVPTAFPALKEFVIPLAASDKLGETAHLVQVELQVQRDPLQAPVAVGVQVLVPISQQPGLYAVRDNTMQAAWAGLGFGPTLNVLNAQAAGPVWDALQAAQAHWTRFRTVGQGSLAAYKDAPADNDAAREVRTALVARLKGTHWFAPAGAGPRPTRKAVQPLVVPLGFAPCQPHVALKGMTQIALQRLGTGLADAIDLAYVDWSKQPVSFHRSLFERLAGLASPDGTGWKGPLPSFAKLLTDRLLYPQPDIDDAGNEAAIRALSRSIRDVKGDLAHLALAVRRQLVSDPSSFAQAKALLLTQLRFADDASAGWTPPPSALAGARFMRLTANQTATKSAPTTVNLGLADLVLCGDEGAVNLDERLGFLELLDDTAYGDTFYLPVLSSAGGPVDFVLESYEEKIDPSSQGPSWKQLPVLLPLAAANVQGAARRPVHLASRALVVPPQVQPIDRVDTLDSALRAADAPTKDWGLEDLRKGKGGYGGSGPLLSMIARRTRPAVGADPIEQATAYVLYTVTGDEERAQSLVSSFENDSFFIELTAGSYVSVPAQSLVSDQPRSDVSTEQLLRELAFAERGSAQAATAIEQLVLPKSGFDFSKSLEPFVHPSSAVLPSDSHALLRVGTVGKPAPILDFGNAAQFTRKRLREVALFGWKKDADLSSPRTSYLLVGFETSVWRPIEARLIQGRNVPEARWTGGAELIDTPRFAKEFWQSAAQEGTATRHALTNREKGNKPSDWGKLGRVVKLDPSWRGNRTARQLVDRMLFTAGIAVGDHAPKDGILHPTSKDLVFTQELSIQVYHQQFDQEPSDPGAEPFSAIATRGHAAIRANSGEELKPRVWFDPRYDHFSVDFRWFAPNGTNLLSLTSLYVRFD